MLAAARPVDGCVIQQRVSADDFRWWLARLGWCCVLMHFEATSIFTLSNITFISQSFVLVRTKMVSV